MAGRELVLTIFTAPRPFEGEFERLQRNALTSWTQLVPRPEVIVFGADRRAESICDSLGVACVLGAPSTATGALFLDDVFRRAEERAASGLLAYINPDVIVMQDFMDLIIEMKPRSDRLLLVGAPWNASVDFTVEDSVDWVRVLSSSRVKKKPPARGSGADVFVFPLGAFETVPPLAIGRHGWDHWLLWRAAMMGLRAVDISDGVMLIHQDHAGTTHRDSVGSIDPRFRMEVDANLDQLRWWERITRRSDIGYTMSDGVVTRRYRAPRCWAIARVVTRQVRFKLTAFAMRLGVVRAREPLARG